MTVKRVKIFNTSQSFTEIIVKFKEKFEKKYIQPAIDYFYIRNVDLLQPGG